MNQPKISRKHPYLRTLPNIWLIENKFKKPVTLKLMRKVPQRTNFKPCSNVFDRYSQKESHRIPLQTWFKKKTSEFQCSPYQIHAKAHFFTQSGKTPCSLMLSKINLEFSFHPKNGFSLSHFLKSYKLEIRRKNLQDLKHIKNLSC